MDDVRTRLVNAPLLANRIRTAAERVAQALDQILPQAEGPEALLARAMRYAAFAGGKRLRPFLTLETGALFDADRTALLRTACAIECIHTYSLIHDDLPCMDNDDFRRGHPTTHKQFGEVAALLAGDALLTFAFEVLADPETHRDPAMRCQLIAGLAKAAGPAGMVAGQMIDMSGAPDDDPSLIARMNRLKTGALIAFSVEAGALIGGAQEHARLALLRFAHDLGAAFQVVDDVLDVESSMAELGKTPGKDAAQGKVNYVAVFGLEGAKAQAHSLAGKAKAHLAMFGSRARILLESVDFILDRRS
jgi:farnesyl diphosphate synthase